MIAIVTGAAGFVGSHLSRALLGRGAAVTGIDSLITGTERTARSLEQCDGFRFIHADVADGIPPEAGGADVTFHFASPASPIDYANEPVATLRANANGTESVARHALLHGSRVVYASTSEVYGDPLEHPQRETYWGNVNPNGERSCYDESKRYGEAMLFAYHRAHGLDVRIVRIFNTYGPNMRMNDGRVIPAFISSALAGEPLTVFGEGRQTRSLCYVDDLVRGILAFADLDAPAHRVVNLGNDQEITVLDIAQAVCDAAGVPLRVERRPLPRDDPGRRRPDLTRARQMLAFAPRVALRDGLRRTVQSVRPVLQTTP